MFEMHITTPATLTMTMVVEVPVVVMMNSVTVLTEADDTA